MLVRVRAVRRGLAWLAGLNPATMVLGTAPGGIAEMAITAKVLQLGVPVVTAFQVCRLVAVLMLVEPLYRRGCAALAGAQRPGRARQCMTSGFCASSA
jgi:uncharacterized membrane protein AbrB (regulator of aidB expression)